MRHKYILPMLLFCLVVTGFFLLFKSKSMNIKADNIEKIECIVLGQVVHELSEEQEIIAVVNFFNSFSLARKYSEIDCARPSTVVVFHYKDGSTETISYDYTSLVYRDIRYRIDVDRTKELDKLLSSLADIV